MANLIRKNNDSSPNPNKGRIIAAAILSAFAIICGLIYLATHLRALIFIGGVAIFIIIIIAAFGKSSSSDYEARKYGDMGERRTGSLLQKNLPSDYTIIQNAKIRYGGGVSETDNIIIGKTGVFIIEVKNMKGTICGNYEDQYWVQNKIDQYDIEHKKQFYNPAKQTGTHIYRLANHLRDNKVFTHINGAVYFANPEAKVEITGASDKIPIYTYRSAKKLLDYIMSGSANLSEKDIEKIIRILS